MAVLDQFRLADHVIIVTGGGGLLGTEYTRALAEAGARVLCADIDHDAARRAAAAANAAVGEERAVGVHVNVTVAESVTALVHTAESRWGRVDGLVNNAAIDSAGTPEAVEHDVSPHRFEDFPRGIWDYTLEVNVTGMFLCAQAAAKAMLRAGGGAIVNISSVYGRVAPDQRLYDPPTAEASRLPLRQSVTYSVSKSAALGLTTYLAGYYAGRGIRVNALTPGSVFHGQPDEFVHRYSAHTMLGRMAARDEYNAALVFLLSAASAYMTGANLIIDGGWTAW